LASRENIFYEHPESSRYENIKLQDCLVIAVNFFCVRSQGATLRMAARLGGRWHIWQQRLPNISDLSQKSTSMEHGFVCLRQRKLNEYKII
jgi:hypothetical protein